MDNALLRISHASQILAAAALAAGIAAAFGAMASQPDSQAVRISPDQVRLDIVLPRAAACARIVSVGTADPGAVLVTIDVEAACAAPGEAAAQARIVDVPAGLGGLRMILVSADGTILDKRRLAID